MAGFPQSGETTRAGGASIARVSDPQVPSFPLVGATGVARPFVMDGGDIPAGQPGSVRGVDGIPSAVRLDDTTGTFAFDRPQCLPDDWDGKQNEPAADYWDFHAAGCYVPVGCNHTAPHWERWWERASKKVQVASKKRLANRVWYDAVAAGTGYANPSLMSVGAIPGNDLSDGGGPVHPRTAIGTLIQGYFDATDTPGDAVLHIPPILSASVFAEGVVRVVNGRAFGPLEIPVSFGPYPAQVGLDGADIGDVSSTYIAISGPIYAEEGDVREAADPTGFLSAGGIFPEGRSNPRLNQNQVIAERRGIFAFDPGPVFVCSTFVPSPAK